MGDDGSVRAVVSDEGAGFDQSRVAGERLGLRVSIIERMRAVGGSAVVQSSPGHGTRIVLTWPGGTAGAAVAALVRETVDA